MRNLFFTMVVLCCLTACSSSTNYAPVVDIATIEHVPKSGVYRVLPGETLYSIAWRYGLDYRYIATLNHIPPPYHVVAGQRLSLARPVLSKKLIVSAPAREPRESNVRVSAWQWPARGPVVGYYSALNKGINISGHLGDPIYATAAGQIVYSGSGLRGYGHLIIIKHNSSYLTAYAHNRVVLVREGQKVRAGQKIAEMGSTGTRRVMLHFEIRLNGRPVNPLDYLSVIPAQR